MKKPKCASDCLDRRLQKCSMYSPVALPTIIDHSLEENSLAINDSVEIQVTCGEKCFPLSFQVISS